MKKQILFWSLLFLFHLPSPAQTGFLGKRVHFQFESKFTPAWSNLNFNHKQGVFRFNYHLMPSIEYVFGRKWSASAHYQYSTSGFKIQPSDLNMQYLKEGYFMENGNKYQGYTAGDMTVHGCGANILYYFGKTAPIGYYMKLGVDAFFYDIAVPYTGYDTLIIISTGTYSTKEEYVYNYQPGVYTAKDWAMGVRFEIGRNFFIGKYLSLGTSLSCGILCKGWGDMIYNSNPQFIDSATKRLFTSYIGGVSIKIGFLPF